VAIYIAYLGVKLMLKIIITYLLIINFVGFIIMLIDKKRAVHKEWRIPEKTLIGISIIGGSIGMLFGMSAFRHKTKHIKFKYGVPFILFIQIGLIVLYFNS
jgi:uncharacterized membrane protein YsdA (DUF1294 family)